MSTKAMDGVLYSIGVTLSSTDEVVERSLLVGDGEL